jgi:hypothetical protein
MRAPQPTPDGLPARAAIIIIGCLIVVLAALWLSIPTKTVIAIGVGALALLIAGVCAFAHRHGLKPL